MHKTRARNRRQLQPALHTALSQDWSVLKMPPEGAWFLILSLPPRTQLHIWGTTRAALGGRGLFYWLSV